MSPTTPKPTSGRRIAAFDFDGTLTRRDTLVPFLVRSCGAAAVARATARVAPVAVRSRLGHLEDAIHHRDATKVAMLRHLFAGREAAWLAEQGAAFASTLPGRLRPVMIEQVGW